MPQRLLGALIVALAFIGLAPSTLRAIVPTQSMAEMFHTAWTGRDGLEGMVFALAQTKDGYLWIGTSAGLYRFDGLHFEAWPREGGALPSSFVYSLLATPDNGLWVGFRQGGAAFIKDGKVKFYEPLKEFPVGTVRRFVRTKDGRVWAATVGGFSCFQHGKWGKIGAAQGYDGNSPDTLFVDNTDNLWAATGGKIQILHSGKSSFEDTGVRIKWAPDIIQSTEGRIWALDGNQDRFIELQGSSKAPTLNRTGDSSHIAIFDRDGTLWMTSEPDAMRRVAYPSNLPLSVKMTDSDPRIEMFTKEQGFTSTQSFTVLEDREGNIWVGTARGLDRFRYRNIRAQRNWSDTTSVLLFAGEGSDVWAVLEGLEERDNSPTVRVQDGKEFSGFPGNLRSVFMEDAGSYWLSQTHHFWHWTDHNLTPVAMPDGLDNKFVVSSAMDKSGNLWAAIMGYGLYRRDKNNEWHWEKPLAGQPKLTPNGLFLDNGNTLWITYLNALVAVNTRTGKSTPISNTGSIGLLNLTAGDSRQNWVGGENGLGLVVGTRLVPILGRDGTAFGNTTGVVASTATGLWLAASNKLIHIPRTAIDAIEKNHYRVQYEVYDEISDLPSQIHTGVEGRDGVIWFAGTDDTIRVDPNLIRKNTVPPPVHVESIVADKVKYALAKNMVLPALTRDLSLAYTAVSLTIPERVKSRYRLIGWDKDWQESGNRHEATYSNLPPGSYEFRVIACNNDGVWNEIGDTVTIRIRPAFYQTWWFSLLLVLAIGLLIWVIYLRRLSRATQILKSRMTAQMEERERIARELHDTLLQGFQGLILHLQHAFDRLTIGASERNSLDRILDEADGIMIDARDQVMDLRATSVLTTNLRDAFYESWKDLAELTNCQLQVQVQGVMRPLQKISEREVRLIGNEAISNALRHAQPRHVAVTLDFTAKDTFSLRVYDDGIGISTEVMKHGAAEGHWGLTTMQERAARLGGRLTVRSGGADPGTLIQLTVSSNVAYAE